MSTKIGKYLEEQRIKPSKPTGDIVNAFGKLENVLYKKPFRANIPGGSAVGVITAMGNG